MFFCCSFDSGFIARHPLDIGIPRLASDALQAAATLLQTSPRSYQLGKPASVSIAASTGDGPLLISFP